MLQCRPVATQRWWPETHQASSAWMVAMDSASSGARAVPPRSTASKISHALRSRMHPARERP